MSIPEAVQLVIQAGAMGKGGDVFVLDMGDSVKISHLTTKMIKMSGLSLKKEEHPEGDMRLNKRDCDQEKNSTKNCLLGIM